MQIDGIKRIFSRPPCFRQGIVVSPEFVVAYACLNVQAVGRLPVKSDSRPPFVAASRPRAGNGCGGCGGTDDVEDIFVVVGDSVGFVQFFILNVGGEGHGELVAQAHAVADVGAGTGGAGALFYA